MRTIVVSMKIEAIITEIKIKKIMLIIEIQLKIMKE